MSTDKRMKVLCIIAHPDDLELMAGGTIAKWVGEGHAVHVLTFSDGSWTNPNGTCMRAPEEALAEEKKAAAFLGYTVENLSYPAMGLQFDDKLVCEVLTRIDRINADLILCPWDRDLHHDHEVVSRIAISASRRVPKILMGQINYYLRDVFTPNVFVDISSTWDQKIESLKCFKEQWSRAGEDWYKYLDETTRYYGRMIGVERAEGFITKKFLF